MLNKIYIMAAVKKKKSKVSKTSKAKAKHMCEFC